jgi:predicted AAA+ superfamily ATPase
MEKITYLKRVSTALQGLLVFDDILRENKIKDFYKLLRTVTEPNFDMEKVYLAYHNFYRSLAGDNWVEYIIECLCTVQNEFTLRAARTGYNGFAPSNLQDVARDLAVIQSLAKISPQNLLEIIEQRFKNEVKIKEVHAIFHDSLSPENWPIWNWGFSLTDNDSIDYCRAEACKWLDKQRKNLIISFIQEPNWKNNIVNLVNFYYEIGCGIYGKYGAFKIHDSENKLVGIKNPDPIRLKNLICQEREQAIVLNNTINFLDGYPANNIILYGNRGTGKSSLVKALLNEYISKGLRLVQLKKNQISFFPQLIKILQEIPLKFIIFIDDLSFNDEEEDYKSLKSLLEGGVEARPDNVLIYATSNRRHLVKESFADRQSDDVHSRDTMEEKLSLADRFGITVTFLSPDQETYLKIVEELAVQNNLNIDRDELRQRALKWVMMHNGRSGRTAKQFIDHLSGTLNREKTS